MSARRSRLRDHGAQRRPRIGDEDFDAGNRQAELLRDLTVFETVQPMQQQSLALPGGQLLYRTTNCAAVEGGTPILAKR